MIEIDERLVEIRARLDPNTDIDVFDHHAPADLCYLLELVTDLRQQLAAHDAEASAVCQEWDVKYQALAQKCDEFEADREYNAELVIERDAMLATVTALVPEAEWLEMVALSEAPLGPADCAECPFDGPGRCDVQCNNFDAWAVVFATAIRNWREEENGESANG